MRFGWFCPNCGAHYKRHGKGKCLRSSRSCKGFVCECGEHTDAYRVGISLDTVCPTAKCYHCGWGDSYPDLAKIENIQRFASLLGDLRDGDESANIKLRVILHEWLAQCVDIFVENLGDTDLCGKFGDEVLVSMWSYLRMVPD